MDRILSTNRRRVTDWEKNWTEGGLFGTLLNKLVPCVWLLSGALEVRRLRLPFGGRIEAA